MRSKNLFLRYFGLTVLTIGIILNVLMFVENAYPTYLFFIVCGIGIIQFGLSFLSNQIKKPWQIFWSLIPFIIGFIYFQSQALSKDLYLIPDGYRGKIVIHYGQLDGQPKEYDGKYRVYRIPQNGGLKTQFEIKGNILNFSNAKYYFIDKAKNKTEIKRDCENCKDRDTSTVQVILGNLSSDNKGTFQDFFIDIPNRNFKDKRLKDDSIQNSR